MNGMARTLWYVRFNRGYYGLDFEGAYTIGELTTSGWREKSEREMFNDWKKKQQLFKSSAYVLHDEVFWF